MTIQHIYLMARQANVASMVEWYSIALAPLGHQVMFRASEALVALGPKGGWPNFWIRGHEGEQTVPTHVCFQSFGESFQKFMSDSSRVLTSTREKLRR